MAAVPGGHDMSRLHIPSTDQFSSKIIKKDYKLIVLFEGDIDLFDKKVKKNILENYELKDKFHKYDFYKPLDHDQVLSGY
jgi:hypothetical protein